LRRGIKMGFFKSKEQKEVEIALVYLNQFLIDQYKDWTKRLQLMIGAKATSENAFEKVEPFVQQVWVETYKYSIQLMIESGKAYEFIQNKTPLISVVLPLDEYKKATRDQARRIGESVGSVIRELCDIKPEWEDSLMKHLDEPLVSELKAKAKESLSDYLKANSDYYS
jgi:hypothetical protein